MLCRKLDVVTVKGSAKPMTLYTFDVAEDEANLDAATELTSRWIDTQKHWKTGKPPGGDDADTVMDENVDHRLKYLDRVDAGARRAPPGRHRAAAPPRRRARLPCSRAPPARAPAPARTRRPAQRWRRSSG